MVALRCAWKRCLALPCSLDVHLPASATGGGRLHPISSQAIPCGYLDGLVARRDRKTLEAQKTRRTIVRLAFVVSGGYLSFRALRTWALRVGPGAALCADGNSVRNSRISSPVERLPHTPLLTGSPVPSSCHRQRSQSSLPVLEQLRFAASCTAGAHRRCVSSQGVSRLSRSKTRKNKYLLHMK